MYPYRPHALPGWAALLAASAAALALSACRPHGAASRTPIAGGAAPAATAGGSGPATPPAGSATTRPPDCLAARLSASVDASRDSTVHGAHHVVILLRNTGTTPCWLGGLPVLSGVDGSRAVRLPFLGSTDPAYAGPGPAAGPGPVPPGGSGALHLTMQVDGCAKAPVRHATLRVTLRPGQWLELPYPRGLTVSGCFGDEAQAGPVVPER